MTDSAPGSAATQRLTVSIDKFGYTVPVNVRNGVLLCPHCGDEMVEVSRDTDGANYECRTGKGLWDIVRRDLAAAFDAVREAP